LLGLLIDFVEAEAAHD
jgi:hypothetical protein